MSSSSTANTTRCSSPTAMSKEPALSARILGRAATSATSAETPSIRLTSLIRSANSAAKLLSKRLQNTGFWISTNSKKGSMNGLRPRRTGKATSRLSANSGLKEASSREVSPAIFRGAFPFPSKEPKEKSFTSGLMRLSATSPLRKSSSQKEVSTKTNGKNGGKAATMSNSSTSSAKTTSFSTR